MITDDFLKKVAEKLEENKDLTKSSIKLYINNLNSLYKKLGYEKEMKNLKWLKDSEVIKNMLLNNNKFSTHKTHLGGILSILSVNKSPTNNKLYKTYTKQLEDLVEDNKKVENKKTEKQEKNWKEFEEIMNIQKNLSLKVDTFKKNEDITKKEFTKLLELLVLSLFTLQEPRRNQDYLYMYFVMKDNERMDKTKNYIFKDGDKYKVVFNKFKTSKKYGSQSFTIESNELNNIIDSYMKHHPHNTGKKSKNFEIKFLVKATGEPLEKINSITRILNRVIGADISSSMLRHIFLSYKFGDNLKDRIDTAEKMGHSKEQQTKYIKFD